MSAPLKLNLTNEEANSEPRDYEVLPTGKYVCNVVDITDSVVKPTSKNSGKPYWKIRFVVDMGDYAGRSIYANVMLFEGALYSAKQLVEAVFPDMIEGNQLSVPSPEAFMGKQLVVSGVKYRAGTKQKNGEERQQDTFEVKSYKPANSIVKKTGDMSILP